MGLPRFWVNTSTLNLVIEDTDFVYKGLGPDINLTRTYNLNPGQSGMFGNGWRFRYDSEIAVTCNGGWLKKGSGQQLFYTGETCPVTPSYPITTTAPPGNPDSLALAGPDIWLLEDKETRWTYRYDFVKDLETGTDPLSFKTLQLTSITDQNGNQVQVVLNADATINYLQDAAGRRTTFTYDANRRCTRMVTPNGEQATYAYDARGNLVSSTDLLGNLTTYAYDAGNYMTSMTVGNKTTRFAYSGTGREKKLASVTDALGHVTTYSAAASGMDNVVSVRDPEGKITKFTSHDGKNTRIVDPLQYEALKGYAPTALNSYTTGLKTDITDRRGVPTSLVYDARNNLTATSIPQGIKRAFTYDLADNPVSKTVAHWGNSQTWQYAYDAKRNLTQITSPSLKQTVRTFDAKGQITSLRNANGKTFSFEHDAFGNPVKVTDPLGNTIQLTYDPWGINVTGVTDALGNTSHLEYDANRRLTKVIHPDNAAMTLTYDCCSLTAVTDENGNTTSIASNKLLSPVSVTNPLGHSTSLSYDTNNKLTAVQDPLGNRATISDDAGGRPVTLTNALDGTVLRQYDAEWNMTAVIDERGNTTSLEYDSNHLPTAETDPLGNIVRRIRDDAGRFTGIINSRNAFISFSRDADGRKTGKAYNGVSVPPPPMTITATSPNSRMVAERPPFFITMSTR